MRKYHLKSDVTELSGVTGEFLYVELSGVPEGADIKWISENEAVCTVTGDIYGGEIYVTGVGETVVTAEWDGGDAFYHSDSVTVHGQLP